MDPITAFTGDFAFLSNFFPAPVEFDGVVYPTAEHAYQAAKTLDAAERRMLRGLESPGRAKRAGLTVTLRAGWESMKLDQMRAVVLDKFRRNPELAERLLATGTAHLAEGNDWGDRYWGVVRGDGANHLGRILMAVRAELAGEVPSLSGAGMKLVFISDTHLQHGFTIPGGDVLVHAGDALNHGRSLAELQEFLYWFTGLPHPHKVYVAGNHDWLFDPDFDGGKRMTAKHLLREAGVTYLEDQEATVAGLRIYGSPWQPEFCGWAFNLPHLGPELQRRWDAIPSGLDILVTHSPPAGILDENDQQEGCGCPLLAARVEVVRPKVHAFGHIHEGYGRHVEGDTLFLNASVCDGRYRPRNAPHVITLDTVGCVE